MERQDLLVGLIGLALLPLIGLRLWRGVRDGRLPLYRTYVSRSDDRGKFSLLLVLHALSFVLVAGITADLLLGLGFRT
ncbi:MAG TPA: hypothetical protein VF759_10255 [Allosphingosinicella sp.]|jgi:hypothetical protein